MTSFVYIRVQAKSVVSVKHMMVVAIIPPRKFSGLSKFGIRPGGGFSAGVSDNGGSVDGCSMVTSSWYDPNLQRPPVDVFINRFEPR